MNQRKPNISRWYLLGLAALLMAGSLMLSIGTTLARYRVENEKTILFEPRAPIAAALGKMDENGVFVPTNELVWTPQTDGTKKLTFAVSNYIAGDTCQEENLLVRVRLVGSLAAWSEEETASFTLTDKTVLEEGAPRNYTAQVMRIPQNTALYHAFGDGWVFRFLDESGEELAWTLEGGVLSCVELDVTMDASSLTGTSLLQFQIVGEIAP